MASKEIENILDNTDFMILLSQAQSDRTILAKQLGISEHQLSYITHSNSGEGLLFYGNVTIPFVDRFPRGEFYDLRTSRPEDAKTRPVVDGYKASRYSKKYLAQHEAELATYRAAKDTMNTILNGAKLPKIEALKKSRRELAGQKKELYAEYREAQRQMREAVAIKANIDHLLGITDERENKAQER